MSADDEPITVTDSDTGQVFVGVPNDNGDTVIDFGDGSYAVHIGEGLYRLCVEGAQP